MQKYALMSILATLVVGGCVSTPKTTPKPSLATSTVPTTPSPTKQITQYNCDQEVRISAKHTSKPKGAQDFAKIVVHAPILGLDHQPVELLQVACTLGTCYMNDKNPNSIYKWRTQDAHAYFSVNASGEEYGYHCQAQ